MAVITTPVALIDLTGQDTDDHVLISMATGEKSCSDPDCAAHLGVMVSIDHDESTTNILFDRSDFLKLLALGANFVADQLPNEYMEVLDTIADAE